MRRGQAQIEVTFDIDANGLVSVTATDAAGNTSTSNHTTDTTSTNLFKVLSAAISIAAAAATHAAADAKASAPPARVVLSPKRSARTSADQLSRA